MTSDDVPTAIFAGPYEEAIFLRTLIESAGIHATLDGPPHRRGTELSTVYVRKSDATHAKELVDHFLSHGHRTKE